MDSYFASVAKVFVLGIYCQKWSLNKLSYFLEILQTDEGIDKRTVGPTL